MEAWPLVDFTSPTFTNEVCNTYRAVVGDGWPLTHDDLSVKAGLEAWVPDVTLPRDTFMERDFRGARIKASVASFVTCRLASVLQPLAPLPVRRRTSLYSAAKREKIAIF